MQFKRYAIYYTPPTSPLATFGAGWLGWDIALGQLNPHIDCPGLPIDLPELTETPRKYGLHATIKPPFRLAPDCTEEGLKFELEKFCQQTSAVNLEGLTLRPLGRFLALTPTGDTSEMHQIAARVVQQFDNYRASLTDAELDRRRSGRLSADQEERLLKWGYPHVMDGFRFHMTLTGKMPKRQLPLVQKCLASLAAPFEAPLEIDALSLVGEAKDGFFHLITRYSLGPLA
ncbi:DUF1045 domain-containing protein [Roseovarius sp. EL26]|uniref:DUF1045 domain-containing protein n=1 Tax=Roseovarius sp. EL26 TaxID=2126672 RepID=UPI000EA1DF3F|nr:DUF1045 domain-containing protein [Roseovarius sp. EL26]